MKKRVVLRIHQPIDATCYKRMVDVEVLGYNPTGTVGDPTIDSGESSLMGSPSRIGRSVFLDEIRSEIMDAFIDRFDFNRVHFNEMMLRYQGNGSNNLHSSVCSWLKENEQIWAKWVENLPNFYQGEQQFDLAFSALIIGGTIFLVAAIVWALREIGAIKMCWEEICTELFFDVVIVLLEAIDLFALWTLFYTTILNNADVNKEFQIGFMFVISVTSCSFSFLFYNTLSRWVTTQEISHALRSTLLIDEGKSLERQILEHHDVLQREQTIAETHALMFFLTDCPVSAITLLFVFLYPAEIREHWTAFICIPIAFFHVGFYAAQLPLLEKISRTVKFFEGAFFKSIPSDGESTESSNYEEESLISD